MTELRPSDTPALLHKAAKAIRKNNFPDAESALAEALAQDEQNPAIWEQLGRVWLAMGRTSEALDALNLALTFGQEDADILFNAGKSLIDAGQIEDGLHHIETSFMIAPSLPLAESLGDIFYSQALYAKSCFYYLKVYQDSQSNSALLRRLAFALFQCGETSQAFSLMVTLVNRVPDNADYAIIFSDISRSYALTYFHADIKKAVASCLFRQNIRYFNLRSVWSSLFLLDPAYAGFRDFCHSIILEPRHFPAPSLPDFAPLFTDRFLTGGLGKIQICSIPIENLLTNFRSFLMAHWRDYESWPKSILNFLAALSSQCWLSDYIYYETPDDTSDLGEMISFLKDHLKEPIKDPLPKNGQISDALASLIALGACYKPLYEILDEILGDNRVAKFSSHATSCLRSVLEDQFYHPQTEKEIRLTLKSFTAIDDTTSKAVQDMYESRPYPRWASATLDNTTDHVREISRNLEILVAGCGTGQEPALLINGMPECHITAIDLSRTSLAYAVRKAKELGYADRVDFLHGDLMKVDQLEQDFDFVVSSGVLHHLKDPEKGLTALLGRLRPHGLLSLSLYSKIARDYKLDPAIAYIREKGYSASRDDIRRFRRDLFSKIIGDPVLLCTETSDFFNLSECNDMLFHVQEHRYTLPELEALAQRHGLEIFDIHLPPAVQKSFQAAYPGVSKLDFAALDEFERGHPGSFMEMYRVYFKRRGEPLTPTLLDLHKRRAF